MTEVYKDLELPGDLLVGNAADFYQKVTNFAASGAGTLHAVFDFDRTLTVKRPDTQDEVTTWHILREHLPDVGQREYQQLFEKYRPLEMSGKMTMADAATWWSSTLNLFIRYKVSLSAVEETFLERASIRPGTAELFKLLNDADIPIVILSAGIREVIDIWCRAFKLSPSLVVSTALILDDRSRVSGWHADTLVHVLNKSESTHPELLKIRAARPRALLIGDSLDDAAMATGHSDVLRVRILDPRADEAATTAEEQRTFTKFDALIKTGTLQSLCELLAGLI